MKTCKHCNKTVSEGHYCESVGREIHYHDDSSFLLSAAIGYATDSALLGGLLGGDMAGGIVGDMLNDSSSPDSSGSDFSGGGGNFGGGGADSNW